MESKEIYGTTYCDCNNSNSMDNTFRVAWTIFWVILLASMIFKTMGYVLELQERVAVLEAQVQQVDSP